MVKVVLIFFCFFICGHSFSQEEEVEKIKFRKLTYIDFKGYSINDTSTAIIDIFFDKSNNSAMSQMSFLPVAAILVIPPKIRPIGIILSAICIPFFINGSYMLVKYRKKKLYKVLTEYRKTQKLPNWVRKKAKKQLDFYEEIKLEY